MYAAYVIAQNKLKYNAFDQQHYTNKFMPLYRWNVTNNNLRTAINQLNVSQNYNRLFNKQRNIKRFNKRENKKFIVGINNKICNKVKNTLSFSKSYKLQVENNNGKQIYSATQNPYFYYM